ncbi:MAG: hypothetical protein CBARDMAM_0243 [uncultured Caballeronia sp.]|nr:MAG: hypothetical protein CBARDMAM_0243 [uncultured Caballeronia sp.]
MKRATPKSNRPESVVAADKEELVADAGLSVAVEIGSRMQVGVKPESSPARAPAKSKRSAAAPARLGSELKQERR